MTNKNSICRALAVLLLGATAAVAHADDTGFYAGGGVGQAYVDELNFDDEDTTLSVFGGYQFNRYFAIEGGYIDLGEIDPETAGNSLGAKTLHASAVGMLPLNDDFSLFAKAGLSRWDADNSLAVLGDEDSGTDPTYGVGAQYRLNDKVALRFDVSRFELEDADVDVAQLQVRYDF